MKEIEKCGRMSEAEYRWSVFYKLTFIKRRIKNLEASIDVLRQEPRMTTEGPNAVTPRELLPPGGLLTQEELETLVENVNASTDNRAILVDILGRAPRKGSSPKEVVYAVTKRLFDWSLSRKYNVRGTKKKDSIFTHALYSVIVDAVKVQAPAIGDGDLREHLKNYLKNCGTNYKRREASKDED